MKPGNPRSQRPATAGVEVWDRADDPKASDFEGHHEMDCNVQVDDLKPLTEQFQSSKWAL